MPRFTDFCKVNNDKQIYLFVIKILYNLTVEDSNILIFSFTKNGAGLALDNFSEYAARGSMSHSNWYGFHLGRITYGRELSFSTMSLRLLWLVNILFTLQMQFSRAVTSHNNSVTKFWHFAIH